MKLKYILPIVFCVAGIAVLSGCVENESYVSDYYSSNGNTRASDYYSDGTAGYNRDYQNHNTSGYYSSSKSSGYSSSSSR